MSESTQAKGSSFGQSTRCLCDPPTVSFAAWPAAKPPVPPHTGPVSLLTVLLLSCLLQDHHKPVTPVALLRLHVQSLLKPIRQPISPNIKSVGSGSCVASCYLAMQPWKEQYAWSHKASPGQGQQNAYLIQVYGCIARSGAILV